jgi:hypothetical protein
MTLIDDRSTAPAGTRTVGVLGAILTVVALVALTGAAWYWLSGGRVTNTETQRQVYRQPVERIEVDLAGGDVTVVGGMTDAVGVTRVLTWSERQKPTVSESFDGTTMRIEQPQCANGGHRCAASYDLAVPSSVALSVHTDGGSIRTEGITGTEILHTSGGDVTVGRASGNLDLSTSGGSISGSDLSCAETVAGTSGGDITLGYASAPNRVVAGTSGGSVQVSVPSGDRYRVQAGASGGTADVAVSQDPAAARSITARTEGGDVRIRYA